MDLFDSIREDIQNKGAPLALRMRPRTLDEFVGQKEVVGEGTYLRRAIEEDQLQTALFWGPPGSDRKSVV